MPDIPVTDKGILKLQRALNVSKAVGPGVIRPRVFKELSTELAPILTLLSQTSLHPEPLRDILETCQCEPFKGEKTNPSNYHPVSLTCFSCKLLEHIICSGLMQHLSTTLYMVSVKKRSCEIQPIEFVHGIAFNMQAGVQNDDLAMEFAE